MDKRILRMEYDDVTVSFAEETARVLIQAYQLHKEADWVWALGDGWETSLPQVLESWVYSHIQRVSPGMAESLFQILFMEFERLYFSQEVYA